jgi:hypothetical protein
VTDGEWSGFKSEDPGVDQPRSFQNGQPLYFEIWDSNYLGDSLLGGFVVYPDRQHAQTAADGESSAEYTAKIQWDWNEPKTVSRPGHARVWIRFTQRQLPVKQVEAGANAK